MIVGPPPNADDRPSPSADDYVQRRVQKIEQSYRTVREQLQRVAQRQKRYYDMRVRVTHIKVGDVVWYYYPRRRQGRSAKWQRFYTGPFTVLQQLGLVTFRIQKSPRSTPFVVHVDKLKICLGVDGDENRRAKSRMPIANDRGCEDDEIGRAHV
jgi:hypothetical protein